MGGAPFSVWGLPSTSLDPIRNVEPAQRSHGHLGVLRTGHGWGRRLGSGPYFLLGERSPAYSGNAPKCKATSYLV